MLVLPGLGADGLTMMKELALLRGAGWHAVGVDAPQHGRRHDDARHAAWATDRDATLRALVTEAAAELPAVLQALRAQGFQPPYVAVGISLGAYSLWQALAQGTRLDGAVLLLGSPQLPGDPPADPAAFAGQRLLAIQAEHDEVVDGKPAERLVTALADGGHDAALHQLPGSPHAVPEPQWWGAWGEVLRWVASDR